MEKKYFMYRTTNIKNNKFYIGVHGTFNIDDGYLGSGKRFRNSLCYHGKENFKREIIEYFSDSKSMYDKEREIVNEELLKNPKCMNLVIGGTGGFTREQYQLGARKMNELMWCNPEWVENHKKRASNRLLKLHSENKLPVGKEIYDWTGKNHSTETKQKISEANSKKQKGIKNSQYGTCWITNGTQNKKIKKESKLPNGFRFGRV